MLWKDIKSWANDKGYDVIKDQDGYYWSHSNDISNSGLCHSVNSLAINIYNHMTENKYIEHQTNYIKDIKHETLR